MKSKFLGVAVYTAALNVVLACFSVDAADAGKPVENGKVKSSLPPVTPLLVADFDRGKLVTLVDSAWVVFTDANLAGKSTLEATVSSPGGQGSKGAMLLTGKLTADFQWGGFAGITAQLLKEGGSTNLSRFTGLQFLARGDGKVYRAVVGKENVTDSNHFLAEFTAKPEWSLIQVPFSILAQSPDFGTRVAWSAENVTAICFIAKAQPGETRQVRLEIDKVSFY
jgi:hypothetical protein